MRHAERLNIRTKPLRLLPCRAASVALAVSVALPLVACDPKQPAPAPTPATETTATAAPAKDDMRLSKENWPNGSVKYTYEMRRNPDGKWARNGIGKAYYSNGVLEREGMYRDNKRVGEWKYYDDTGKLLRSEDRGTGTVE